MGLDDVKCIMMLSAQSENTAGHITDMVTECRFGLCCRTVSSGIACILYSTHVSWIKSYMYVDSIHVLVTQSVHAACRDGADMPIVCVHKLVNTCVLSLLEHLLVFVYSSDHSPQLANTDRIL